MAQTPRHGGRGGCLRQHSPDDFLTLPALVAHFGELGYDVVEMVLADQEGWDRYEAAKWLTMPPLAGGQSARLTSRRRFASS